MNWNITAGRPVYVQLIEQLELALVAGNFRPAAVSRPVRELAADAGVNPNTMQRALQDLESRGLLQAQRTAGRTVTANDTVLQALRRKRAATLARDFLQQMHALGMDGSRGRDPAAGNRNIRKGVTQWNLYMKSTACANTTAKRPRWMAWILP